MHYEILVEGAADLTAVSILIPKFLGRYGDQHTWKIHKHRGVGIIPHDPSSKPDKRNQTLLHNLPSKLRAYGMEDRKDLIVVVLVDLDDRLDCRAFKNEISLLLKSCPRKPTTLIRIAIEEIEAWFLGDRAAMLRAYPNLNESALATYSQDSQCGTWETLAEAVFPGGLKKLTAKGHRSVHILEQKRKWAADISQHMEPTINQSPSFHAFRDGILSFINNT